MLTPLTHSTSYRYTSSEKLTCVDEQQCPLDYDFFKPIATENGVSCTYSNDFYAAFSQGSSPTQLSELALLVLDYMTIPDKARLPLFDGASDRYVKQVLAAILKKILTRDDDDETLSTKFQIMNCASQLGYLTHPTIFYPDSYKKPINLDKVSLIKMDLRGAKLIFASLREADLREADLRESDLTDANLNLANLTGTNLTRANLTAADFTGANLTAANLTLADLTGADLTGTDLTGAVLTRAVLTGVDLTKTVLSKKNNCLIL